MLMETGEKYWSFAAALCLVLATFSGSILQVLHRILIAFLADLKSRRHIQMEVECEGNKGETEKGMCLSVYELEGDILVEIFSRLPVKLVFQLKSVCRRWNAIISSPYLASMHLRNYTNGPAGNASQSLIVSKLPDEYFFYAEQLYPDADTPKIRQLDISLPIITGPCNGIFLLGCLSGPCHLYMWNPATDGFRELPLPKPRETILLEDVEMSCNSCGFGLDTIANDLKLVVIRHFHLQSSCPFPGRNPLSSRYSSPKFPSQVLVYTLGTDTWRELEEFSQEVEMLPSPETCRYLNGFVFWPCVSPVTALTFDLGSDVFRVINDPVTIPFDAHFYNHLKQLSVYKDSLALFIIQESGGYDMWLLSEEDWCWVKHVAISPFIPKYMMVVGHWRENQLMVITTFQDFEIDGHGRQLLLLDPCTQTSKVLLSDCLYHTGFFAYKESLVNVGEMRLHECSYRFRLQ